MTKTIIVTGVHHTPAIELFRLLSEDKANIWKIVYLTRQEIKDTHISHTIKHLKIVVYPIITSKYDRRKRFLSLILAPINLLGIVQSLYYLVRYQPSLVVSFGGYASFPVVFASPGVLR
jgi:UDP-N-acetylglucosamine:LPS N-acetylglucosamine transferase